MYRPLFTIHSKKAFRVKHACQSLLCVLRYRLQLVLILFSPKKSLSCLYAIQLCTHSLSICSHNFFIILIPVFSSEGLESTSSFSTFWAYLLEFLWKLEESFKIPSRSLSHLRVLLSRSYKNESAHNSYLPKYSPQITLDNIPTWNHPGIQPSSSLNYFFANPRTDQDRNLSRFGQ